MNYNAKILSASKPGGDRGNREQFLARENKSKGLAPKAVHAENKLEARVLPVTILILSRLCAKG